MVEEANSSCIDKIITFVKNALEAHEKSKIPTGIILNSGASASQLGLYGHIQKQIRTNGVPFVSLDASDAPNLKTFLKTLITRAIQIQPDEVNGDGDLASSWSGGRKLLNYDLQLLYDWCTRQRNYNVVVLLQNAEAFENDVLTNFILLAK